jgi:hypothetical protein
VPLEGLIYARSGVALARHFLGRGSGLLVGDHPPVGDLRLLERPRLPRTGYAVRKVPVFETLELTRFVRLRGYRRRVLGLVQTSALMELQRADSTAPGVGWVGSAQRVSLIRA